MKKFLKVNKLILIYLLIFFFTISITILPNYIHPKPAEGLVLVDDVIFWCVAAILISVIGGVLYNNQSAARDIGESAYNEASPEVQEDIQAAAAEGEVNGSYNVKASTYTALKDWTDTHLTDTVPPVNDFTVTGGQQVRSPWGTSVYLSYYLQDFNTVQNISASDYASSFLYDTLGWSDSNIVFNMSGGTEGVSSIWKIYFNGVMNGTAPYDDFTGGVFPNVFFDSVYDQTRYYYKYVYNSIPINIASLVKPKFGFFKSEYTGITWPVIVYRETGSPYNYKAAPFIYGFLGSESTLQTSAVVKDVNATVIPGAGVDLSAGTTYLPYTENFYDITNVYPSDVLLGNWATAMTASNVAIEESINRVDERLGFWEPWLGNLDYLQQLANLSKLNDLTFDETGALTVTMDNAVASAPPYELDIPINGLDFNSLRMNWVGITDKFPFSIPFDLAGAFTAMLHEPEVPIINVDLSNTPLVGAVDFDIDFTMFQPIANVIKWAILILFNIGLIMVTRKLIRG